MTTFSNGETGLSVRTKINEAISHVDRLEGLLSITASGGTVILDNTSETKLRVTGTTTHTIVLPDVTTLQIGWFFIITNDSTGSVSVQSSGLNGVQTIPANTTSLFQCILDTGTTNSSWIADFIGFGALTGSGSVVRATSPTLVTPALGTPASGVMTNVTGLPLTTGVTGTLPVANGGTGAATLTGYVKAAGTAAMTASATIPNTDITGLGTMSTQAASAVAITGGTINGASVGATTPSTVKGSSLESTSVITDSFATRAAGTLALAFASDGVVQVTPNATGTFTTTVPPAGTRCTLIILTSGTTSFTMTFGTGFKTTGTLATGTVTARRFVMEFISDGTNLIESSRTVAIA